MPRINEHSFRIEEIDYKLTYYQNTKPIIYVNENIYEGNKSVLLRKYINQLELGVNLDKLTTQQLSGIILKYFTKQNNYQLKKISPKLKSSKVERTKKPKTKKQNSLIDEKIDKLLNSLDWKSLKDSTISKLLIIGCSDSKTQGGGTQIVRNYFDNLEYCNLLQVRIDNLASYQHLFQSEPNYFVLKKNNPDKPVKRDNHPVADNYFTNCIGENLLKPALDRYAGGCFYSPQHRILYTRKNESSNLHILIISGLYGVIKFNDTIIDYHLELDKSIFLQNRMIINDAIRRYKETNNIDDSSVFYSLSQKYLRVLDEHNLWTNLWVVNGRSGSLRTSASIILNFLNKL